MAKAFAQLSAHHHAPISQGGPQVLPLSSGGVAAYKFRDPDGHPLELIHFPGGEPAERWAGAPGLFLGIDHSAITVTDLDAAIGFLGGALGLTVSERGLNRGPGQARLAGSRSGRRARERSARPIARVRASSLRWRIRRPSRKRLR